MKVYVAHPTCIDYENELYIPVRESELEAEHEFILPHEDSSELFDSRSFLREKADLMVAEVSEPSTGVGIELGWASCFGVPVICIHRENAEPSSSIEAVADRVETYNSVQELMEVVETAVGSSGQSS